MTVRRSSLPDSTVHTYSWPEAELIAPMGTVRRGVASPICTWATAYWPARSVSLGLGNCTATPIERVPASAAGAMRASLPVSGLSTPSILSVTGMPAASRATSCVPTVPASSSRCRSTMVTTCCSAVTFSPATT